VWGLIVPVTSVTPTSDVHAFNHVVIAVCSKDEFGVASNSIMLTKFHDNQSTYSKVQSHTRVHGMVVPHKTKFHVSLECYHLINKEQWGIITYPTLYQ